jgi:hypothetical protein
MPNEINEVDRDAFERAHALMLRHKERIYRTDFKRRLDERQEPWADIGRHATSICQIESLGLRPWQTLPCEAEINETDARGCEHRSTRNASMILERLLNAGLSRYELDPPAALARVERESAA